MADDRYSKHPPLWAKDPFNGDCTAQCPECGAWWEIVRPGKHQPTCGCDVMKPISDEKLTEIEAALEASDQDDWYTSVLGQHRVKRLVGKDTIRALIARLRAAEERVMEPTTCIITGCIIGHHAACGDCVPCISGKVSKMADDSDLLPCPHCGSPAKSYHRPDDTGWCNTNWICCDAGDDGIAPECGARTCMHESREDAVAAWNRRTAK